MGMGSASIAAATAVVGYDLAQNTNWQQQGRPRAIKALALKGSGAAGDTKVDLFVDQVKVGEFFNSGTGFPNMDDLFPMGAVGVPPHSQIHVYVTDAPVTNPINLQILWQDL